VVCTAVKNRRAEAVNLALLDLVPVARDGEIQVKVLEGTTKATREDPERPGVRTWRNLANAVSGSETWHGRDHFNCRSEAAPRAWSRRVLSICVQFGPRARRCKVGS